MVFFWSIWKIIIFVKICTMASKEKNIGLNGTKKEKNYVVIDGKKHSKTWAAVLSLKGTGTILNMRAVLK